MSTEANEFYPDSPAFAAEQTGFTQWSTVSSVSGLMWRWVLRVATWDGLLPWSVWLAPFPIQLLLPGQRWAVELAAVVLPIAALFTRFSIGRRHIRTNRCGRVTRQLQLLALCFGGFLLVFIDAVMILTHIMPVGPPTVLDLCVGAAIYSVYLTAMAFAMFPGYRRDGDGSLVRLLGGRPS